MVVGWWVTEDFDSQYKMLWGETRARGVPPHGKNKVQTRICLIIPIPYNITLTHVMVVGGGYLHYASAD
jgi:hypothetical protein